MLVIGLPFFTVLFSVGLIFTHGPSLIAIAVFLLGLGVATLAGICVHLRMRKLRRDLAQGNWFMCLRCGYSLDGLSHDGSCPECGTSYTRSAVMDVWRRWWGDKVTTTRLIN